MDEAAQHFIADIRKASEKADSVDIHQLAGSLAFDVIARASMGWMTKAQHSRQGGLQEAQCQYWQSLQECAATFFKSATGSFWVVLYMLFPFASPLLQILRQIIAEPLLESIINSRKRLAGAVKSVLENCANVSLSKEEVLRKGVEPGCFPALLNGTIDTQTGKALSLDVKTQQGTVMMLAGFETSSSTIANACYLLSHPDNKAALNALTSEVDNLGKHADPEQILSLPYLDAAVKETLRLMPPAHVTAREASRDMFVGGYKICKGQWLMIPIYAIHRNPKQWGEHAACFLPERWLDRPAEKQAMQAKAFMPFGDGARACPGAKFALQEAKLALFRMLQHFDLKLKDPEVPLRMRASATMAAADGIWIKFRIRTAKD